LQRGCGRLAFTTLIGACFLIIGRVLSQDLAAQFPW